MQIGERTAAWSGRKSEGYQVEYIETDGYAYLDLGFKGTNDFNCDIKIRRPSKTIRWDFGARTTSSTGLANAVIAFCEAPGWTYFYAGPSADWAISSMSQNSNFAIGDVSFVYSGNVATITNHTTGEVVTKTRSKGVFETAETLKVFSLNNRASSGCGLYHCIIDDADNHINLVGWVDGDGVVCAKDLTLGELFYNAGTGSFIAGPVVGGGVSHV